MPESYYRILMQNDHGISWFCDSCRSKVTAHSTTEKLTAIDDKLQFLIDMTLPVSTNGGGDPDHNTAFTKPWNELFGKITDASNTIDSIKHTFTTTSASTGAKPMSKPNTNADEIPRSVVVYGLPESNTTQDTENVDQIVHALASNITISKFRRLKSKRAEPSHTGPAPLMITLATEFDQRKLLALAPQLKLHQRFKKVYIKQALSTSEQLEVTHLRQQCKQLNDANLSIDPNYDIKLVVLDGKARVSTRQPDGKWKADWKSVINLNQLQEFALLPDTADV
jgi:hypothetical protein